MADIEIEGIRNVMIKLKKVDDLGFLKMVMKSAAAHVKGKIAKYPPATAANSSAAKRWYERGYGPRWRRKDGSVGGSKTSETLGRKWTSRVTEGGLGAVVGNKVSYGPFVQDADHQAGFHKDRGWQTVQAVSEQEAETVKEMILFQLRKIIDVG